MQYIEIPVELDNTKKVIKEAEWKRNIVRVSFCAKKDDRSADSVYQIKEGISINMELPLQDMPKKLLNLNHYLKGPDTYFNT